MTLKRGFTIFPDEQYVYRALRTVWKSFHRPDPSEISSFRIKYGLVDRPYLMMIGDRKGTGGYKNGQLLFRAVGRLSDRTRFTIVCVGGHLC